jgi:hypothetical protein
MQSRDADATDRGLIEDIFALMDNPCRLKLRALPGIAALLEKAREPVGSSAQCPARCVRDTGAEYLRHNVYRIGNAKLGILGVRGSFTLAFRSKISPSSFLKEV